MNQKLKTFGFVVFIVLILSGLVSASDYTYDSEIDPGEFQNWNIIKKVRTGLTEGMAVLENPDRTAKIKAVIVSMRGRFLITYEYMIGDKKYKYEYDFDTKHFGLVSGETLGEKI